MFSASLGNPADWLIRSKHNRNLPDGGKLWHEVLADEALGEIRFILPFRPGQKAREVRQQVWMKRLELPDGQGGRLPVTCLIAREIGAPEGVKPLEWRLLSNREAATFEGVVELIDWYRARWEIELFFHVLKNGCRVEALQLSTIDRLELAITLYLVVAWRIDRLIP